jgi:hypothetical protein
MRFALLKVNRIEVGVSVALVALILLGTRSVGPALDGALAPRSEAVASAGSLQSYWRATMLELRAGWEGAFGQTRGSGYQLLAAMGSPDVESLERYHSAYGGEDVRRVFSQR